MSFYAQPCAFGVPSSVQYYPTQGAMPVLHREYHVFGTNTTGMKFMYDTAKKQQEQMFFQLQQAQPVPQPILAMRMQTPSPQVSSFALAPSPAVVVVKKQPQVVVVKKETSSPNILIIKEKDTKPTGPRVELVPDGRGNTFEVTHYPDGRVSTRIMRF